MEVEYGDVEVSQGALLSSSRHQLPISDKRKQLATEASAGAAGESAAQPPPAKRRLSSCPDVFDDERSSCDSDVEIITPPASSTNPHTGVSNRWALKNFTAWKNKRNAQYPTEKEEQVPSNILKCCDAEVLNKWLPLYASETRKQDGGYFSPKTIYLLLAGILRHMRSLNPTCPHFLHPCNITFKPIHDSLVTLANELQKNDAVAEPKSAESFSEEEEERLWSSGVLSTETPNGLLRAVFFLNAKNFGIISAHSHRGLKLSQIQRDLSPPRYVYTPPTTDSGTGPTGLMLMAKKKNKASKIIVNASPEKGNRCHVHVLDKYIQKIPTEAFEGDDFYLQPIKHFCHPPSSVRWFTLQPVGRNALCRMVKGICADAGIDGTRSLSTKSGSQQSRHFEGEPSSSSVQFSYQLSPQFSLPSLPYSTSSYIVTQTLSSHTTLPTPTAGMPSQQPPQNNTSANPDTLSTQPSVPQLSQRQTTGSSDVGHPTTDHLQDHCGPLLSQQQQVQGPAQSPPDSSSPSVDMVTNSQHPPLQQDGQEANTQSRDAISQHTQPQASLLVNKQPEPQRERAHTITRHPNIPQSPHGTNDTSTHIQCPNLFPLIPQQLSFNNCQVVIYVTPSNIDITSTPK